MDLLFLYWLTYCARTPDSLLYWPSTDIWIIQLDKTIRSIFLQSRTSNLHSLSSLYLRPLLLFGCTTNSYIVYWLIAPLNFNLSDLRQPAIYINRNDFAIFKLHLLSDTQFTLLLELILICESKWMPEQGNMILDGPTNWRTFGICITHNHYRRRQLAQNGK